MNQTTEAKKRPVKRYYYVYRTVVESYQVEATSAAEAKESTGEVGPFAIEVKSERVKRAKP